MSTNKFLPEGFIRIWKVENGYSREMGEPTDLIYNLETGIIYYHFSNDNGTRRCMCPYYGAHGKPCTIEKMKIVEVD